MAQSALLRSCRAGRFRRLSSSSFEIPRFNLISQLAQLCLTGNTDFPQLEISRTVVSHHIIIDLLSIIQGTSSVII